MFKQTMIAAAVVSAAACTGTAAAADYISLGRLVCGSDGGQGLMSPRRKT